MSRWRWAWRWEGAARLGQEWEKLWIGSPGRVFTAGFLSGRWRCSCPQWLGKGGSERADGTLQRPRWPPPCLVPYLCSLPSRSGLFISKIVPVPKFYFPGKGSWHSVLIKRRLSTQCKRYLPACSSLCLKVKFFPLPLTTATKILLCATGPADTHLAG